MNFKLQSFDLPLRVTRIANLHYFEFTNLYRTKKDSHNFWELLYVDKGMIDVQSGSYSGALTVNQLMLHRPNEPHFLSSSDNVAPNVIIIGFECNCDALIPFSEKPVTLSSEHIRALARIMQEGMSIYEPPYDIPNTIYMKKREEYPFGADQMVKIGLEAFLISLVRDFRHPSAAASTELSAGSNAQAVHRYVSENYTKKITLDNLCFLFGLNKTTLCRNFKCEYGVTVLSYINSLKIREAKSLLREKKLSITDISSALGFDSIHYFCRMFRKATGQTPTEYSKTVRAKLEL